MEKCEGSCSSNCCGANIILGDICEECGEHCATQCEDCDEDCPND
jgi:hypothetical protein